MKIYILPLTLVLLSSCEKHIVHYEGEAVEEGSSTSETIVTSSVTRKPASPSNSSITKEVDVLVLDESGAPISHAEVEAVTASMNLGWQSTNSKGEIQLKWAIQDIEWISVRKSGYDTIIQQPYKGKSKPVKVTLIKSKQ